MIQLQQLLIAIFVVDLRVALVLGSSTSVAGEGTNGLATPTQYEKRSFRPYRTAPHRTLPHLT